MNKDLVNDIMTKTIFEYSNFEDCVWSMSYEDKDKLCQKYNITIGQLDDVISMLYSIWLSGYHDGKEEN